MPVRFIIRRLLWLIPVLFVIGLITFVLMHNTPGGPWDREKPLDPQVVENLNRKFGLDQPLPVQFLTYMWNAAQGDLGPSYQYKGRSVTSIIAERLPASAQLGLQSLLLAILIALPLGIISALKQNTWIDYISLFFATLGVTVPSFVTGIFLILVFGVYFRWVPVITQTWSLTAAWWLPVIFVGVGAVAVSVGLGVDWARRRFFPGMTRTITALTTVAATIVVIAVLGRSLYAVPAVRSTWAQVVPWVLPTFVLALPSAAFLARLTRSTMLEAIRQDYVRTARSKGLVEQTIVLRHVLRNAMLPVVTVLGPSIAHLLMGSFFVETMFSVPGIGRLFVQAVGQRDYSVLMGTTLLLAFLIAFFNLVVDVIYGFIDPRIKVEG